MALPLVKASEGLRLESYPDPATGGEPWTVGYGATGPDIGPDTVWTREQAEEWLIDRLESDHELIDTAVHIPLEPHQAAALSSFVYNVGIGAFRRSTMLELLNDAQIQLAADEFGRWVHADGEVMAGLVTRREHERHLFLTGRLPA